MQRTISSLREEQKALRKQADSTEIEAFLRDQVQKDIQHREESITVLEQEWESYMNTVRGLEEEIGYISKKLPSLRLIRDNAKAQINTLAAVAVLQIVQSNIKAIEGAVLQLEQLQLASLSADRVKRLLGI
jgi:predicted  nucleic acid-binding Zn-ribbon protein